MPTNDLKRHVINLFATGHRHDEMSKALKCKYCGNRFQHATKEFNRLYKTYPDKFKIEQPDKDSPKVLEMEQQLDDRIKNDSLYQKHLRTLAMGSPEDKKKEIKKFWGGYYEKHTGDLIRKTIR